MSYVRDLQPGLSERIGKAMEGAGMDLVAFCNATGYSHVAYLSWLSGERTPNSEGIVAICMATGASADWLLGLEGEA